MKLKRIFAWIGIILLAGMYILTLVFSLMHGEVAMDLFKASIYCTIIIHVFLYAYTMVYRYLKGRGDDMRRESDETGKTDKVSKMDENNKTNENTQD